MNQYPLHTLTTQNGLDDVSLLRTLIDALPEQVYVKDTDGCYVLNNLAHVRALGAASPEQIAGMSDLDFYPEELAERYRADERVVLDSGRPLIDKEEPSVDEEGNERWHSTTKVPLRNGDGEIVGLVGTTRDVTDQKEAQKALKESEERFRTAFENSPIGVALVGLDGRRFRVNHALCEMLGHSEEELLSKEYLEHIHPDDRGISSKHRHKTLEKGEGSYILERRYVHADGHTVWNLTSVSLIQDSRGNPSHLVCLHQDITERKEVETKLRKSEARLAEAQRIARLGSWEWDVKTGEVSWSDETFRIYGFESQGFVPTLDQLMEMVHPDDRELVRKNINAALYEGECYDFEHRIVRTDGEERVVHRQAEVVFDDEDEPLRMIGTVHDITERKQAEKAIEQLNHQNELILNSAGEGIYGLDRQGKTTFINPAAARLTGWDAEDLIGRHQHDVLHHTKPDGTPYPSQECPIYAALNDGGIQRVTDEVFWRKDGTSFPVEYVSTPIRERGEIVGAVVLFEDVTERKEAEEALKESEERFRTAFEDAPIGVALVGLDGRRIKVNLALCEMLGYSEEELLGKDYSEVIHPEDREVSADHLRRILEGELETYVLERRYVRADEHTVWNLTSVSLVRDSRGEPSHLVCLHQDITERKELEERLRHQAFYDSLTDLPNRSLFLDRLDHALARARREGDPVAVLLVDLDEFKVVNDSLGHDAGNAVLIEVAERLRGCVRPGDTVGRIFGDEFAVLLEAPAGEEEAKWVSQRIEERLRKPLKAEGQEVHVSPSIGIALSESAEDRPEEILRHADLAMYEAKRSGKAQHEVYEPSMNTRAVKRMNLERDLRRAIEHEEFEVHYQPKVLLETGRIVGVEALVRWEHPDRGLLSASQFIKPAEEIGLIDQIGLWVLNESCRQLKEWQERYPAKLRMPFDLCVNLSAREIRQPDLSEKVTGVLRETGLDPSCLMIEITERTAKEEVEQTIGRLRELKDLGVKLALDDFGTGYCSLVYLEHSVLEFLKIDRLLIHRKREDDPKGYAKVISAMTGMAHSLDLAVIVVEGVETEEQLTQLKEMGCEMVQGHYFAKPLASAAAESLLVEGGSW